MLIYFDTNTAKYARGVTLIEIVATIVILGIAIPPIVQMFSTVGSHDAERSLEHAGLLYAESLMEEIASKHFEDPDSPAGSFGTEEASRIDFDDVDDYNEYVVAPLTRADGSALPGYAGFQARVQVSLVTVNDIEPVDGVELEAAAAKEFPSAEVESEISVEIVGVDLKRIEVMVGWPGGSCMLATLRGSLDRGDDQIANFDGPIDEEQAAASAGVKNGKKFQLWIQNETDTDVELTSVELSANVDHTELHKIKFDGKEILHEHDGLPLPTGYYDITDVDSDERELEGEEEEKFEVEFHDKQSGSVDYTLIIGFSDGSFSKLFFTIWW